MITQLIEEIKRDSTGAAVLGDWLGEGGVPVSQFLAESRANICRTCPENVEKNWWDRVKGTIADAIRLCLGVKNRLALTVPKEDELAVCKVCGCCLPTKIWVPIKHVAEHTTHEQLVSFPGFCWQKRELLEHTEDT